MQRCKGRLAVPNLLPHGECSSTVTQHHVWMLYGSSAVWLLGHVCCRLTAKTILKLALLLLYLLCKMSKCRKVLGHHPRPPSTVPCPPRKVSWYGPWYYGTECDLAFIGIVWAVVANSIKKITPVLAWAFCIGRGVHSAPSLISLTSVESFFSNAVRFPLYTTCSEDEQYDMIIQYSTTRKRATFAGKVQDTPSQPDFQHLFFCMVVFFNPTISFAVSSWSILAETCTGPLYSFFLPTNLSPSLLINIRKARAVQHQLWQLFGPFPPW